MTEKNLLLRNKINCKEQKTIIDIEIISKHFVGDEDIMCDMIQSFLERCSGLLDEIQIAIDHQNASSLELAAHTLKGSVADFFVHDLQKNLGELEGIGRSGRLSNADSVFKSILPQINTVCRELAEFVAEKRTV